MRYAAVHRERFSDPAKLYGADLRERVGLAIDITLDEYADALRWQAGVVQGARELFAGYDLLITPTVGHPRKPRKRIGVDTIEIGGSPIFYRGILGGFTSLVNVIKCPAIYLPVPGEGIPPPAVHLVARGGRRTSSSTWARPWKHPAWWPRSRHPHDGPFPPRRPAGIG